MQMFNGCTMWVLGHYYRVNFDNPDIEWGWNDWVSEDFEAKVNSTIGQINRITEFLTDGLDVNDTDAMKELDSLNSSLTESMESYFKDYPDQLKRLKDAVESSIQELKEKNGWEFPAEYKPLQEFLNKINGLSPNNPEVKEVKEPEAPKLELWNTELNWISAAETGGKWEQKFYKWIDEKKEWQEESALDTTKEDLKWQIDAIDDIDTSKLPENVKWEVKQLQDLLVTMSNVLDNTTPDNVRLLQSFISENLKWTADWDAFDTASKKHNNEFDGKFGDGTLAWLNKVLEITWKYIDGVKELLKQSEASDNSDNIGSEENETVTEGTEEVVEKSSEDSDEDESDQPSTNTEPLKIGEEQYQVMNNSSDIATNTGLTWATFYSTLPYSSSVEWEWDWSEVQPQLAQTTNEDGWDRIYNMRLRDRPDEIYRVKVDAQWNICPTGKNRESNASVVFGNYVSCMRYLKNKLPPVLQDKDVNIWWNGKDYIISLGKWKRRLTVEPMTIDGNWEASNNLTDCLAFLNFTNYLRNKKDLYDIAFKNNNPDLKLEGNELYVRVNKKSNIIYDDEWKVKKMGKRLKVNKEQFWLPNDTDKLNKFIKYNNGEHWRDDWDKKKLNKYYKLIKLS